MKANTIGWLITAFVLSGIVFWAIYMFIDALFINRSIGVVFHRNLIGLPNWFLYSEVFFRDE